jgi:hypothetical protein
LTKAADKEKRNKAELDSQRRAAARQGLSLNDYQRQNGKGGYLAKSKRRK